MNDSIAQGKWKVGKKSQRSVKGCYHFPLFFSQTAKSIRAEGLESKCHVCKTKEENITRFIGHMNKFKSIWFYVQNL